MRDIAVMRLENENDRLKKLCEEKDIAIGNITVKWSELQNRLSTLEKENEILYKRSIDMYVTPRRKK